MPSPVGNRFTIYDALNNAGYFAKNSANAFARDIVTGENLYKGPVEYPKMLFHPEGETRVIKAGEVVVNPLTGPATQNEQREMVYAVAKDEAEEQALVAEGWHKHPALAIRARVELLIEASPQMSEAEKAKLRKAIPSVDNASRIRELEKQLEDLLAMKAAAEAQGKEFEPPAALAPKPVISQVPLSPKPEASA